MPRNILKPAAVAAALVLTLALLAAPVAHAAPAAIDAGPAAWWSAIWLHLAGFWPAPHAGAGAAPASPVSLAAPAGSDMDPDGTPQPTAAEGGDMDPNGAVRPQEGGMMDPNG